MTWTLLGYCCALMGLGTFLFVVFRELVGQIVNGYFSNDTYLHLVLTLLCGGGMAYLLHYGPAA